MIRACIVLWTFVGAGACVEVDKLEDAECPQEGTVLTYESFGEAFMSEYCQDCHASDADNRQGAPREMVFDTRDDVLEHRERIYERAALGNTSMPPGPDDPGAEEREMLAEWLACGAP